MRRTTTLLAVLAILLAACACFAGQAEDAEALPEKFDLRSVDTDGDGVGDRCYVPPVRQQNPFGTCWGFSATAASEISILGSILDYDPEAWKTIDLPGAEAGAEYEVRARARVDGITAVIGMDAPFYGEYSETVTITMP